MTDRNQQMSRRKFIGTGISAGFAVATLPITAWAISTPDRGLMTESLGIPTKDEVMPAYRAMPQGPGPFPTIIVVHEIFGVHEYIQDICRRLAKQGYLAIAPSLYFRQGDVTKMTDIPQILSQVVAKVPQEQVMSDLDATMDWLKDAKESDTTRTGITGFCWGGNATWMYATHNPRLKAAVAWYGPLAGEPTPTNSSRKNPIQIASNLKVPVLGLYAGKDKNISQKDIQQMRQALEKGKSGSKIIVYPKAEHGFHADYRPSYNPAAANDGWNKMLEWFKKYGVS